MAAEINLTGPEPVSTLDHGPKTSVLSAAGGSYEQAVEFDEATERRLVRKMDLRLVLLAFLCYTAAFIDRSNIGNAQTAGMGEDLGYDDAQYQWLLTIFYIPYILFEWTALMYKIIPPHIWASVTVFTWGMASMLQAAAFNWQGLMACRFFLAVAEAGFGPGMPYLFSFYYNRRELGVRCGIYLSAAPLASSFAGALAYGITSGTYRIASWRLLLLVEAIPPLVLAVVVFFVLPDSAATASCLTAEEKAVARARSLRQRGAEDTGTAEGTRLGRLDARELARALATPQAWVQALMYFSCNVAFSSLPVFLPAILTGMGFTSVRAQGLTAPPYLVAFAACILSTWLGDRLQQRGLLIAGLSLVGCAGYVVLATAGGHHDDDDDDDEPMAAVAVRYGAGVFLAAAGVFPAIANILSWVLHNQRGDARRGAGVALLNTVGQCGPLLGTRMFPAREGPRYERGMVVCAAFMLLNAVLALGLRAWFARENDRWDRAAAAAAATGAEARTAPMRTTTAGTGKMQAVEGVGGVEGQYPAGSSKDGGGGWEGSSEWRYAL